MIGHSCINFRSNEQQDRIVKLVDQYTDEDKIRMGMHMAQKEGLELVKKSAKKERKSNSGINKKITILIAIKMLKLALLYLQ